MAESPTRRSPGAKLTRRCAPSASWSPRFVPARAWTSSMISVRSPLNSAGASGSDSSTARLSGVVSRMWGGATRCRARRFAGVSPVRVSIVTGNFISSTGCIRLRATSVASAFSGLTYSVCSPDTGLAASSTSEGRNPASVFPPPVGAISSTLSPDRAAWTMAIWCGRGAQPLAANQVSKTGGSVSSAAPARVVSESMPIKWLCRLVIRNTADFAAAGLEPASRGCFEMPPNPLTACPPYVTTRVNCGTSS